MIKYCDKCGHELEYKEYFKMNGYQFRLLKNIFNSGINDKTNEDIENDMKNNSTVIYEALPCVECGIVDKMRKNGIPKEYLEKRFENYILSKNTETSKSQQTKIDWFNHIINNWSECGNKIISIYGNTGTGKGHLTTAFIYELIKKYGLTCKFIKFNDLLTSIRNTFNEKTENTEKTIIDSYRNADLAVIDEIGLQRTESAWSFAILYSIVDYRFENNKKTILISNLQQSELINYYKQHYHRLYSRVMCTDNIVLQFNWSDYRIGEKK